jgi:hypothetical protein
MVLMIYKQILFSKIKRHLQNTLLFFTDNTGEDLVERGLFGDFRSQYKGFQPFPIDSEHFQTVIVTKKKNESRANFLYIKLSAGRLRLFAYCIAHRRFI